jgi:eukaryotic-like serine/threonine-protein kinase
VGCLEENTVVAFAEARLPLDALVAVEEHVRSCASCHDLLAAALDVSGLDRTAVTERLGPTPAARADATERMGPARPASTPRRDLLAPGTSIGRFTVLGLVGRGGMGEVYAALRPEPRPPGGRQAHARRGRGARRACA